MQKFIVKITSEQTTLLSDSQIGCFLLDSQASESFNREFAEQAKLKGKLVLVYGEQAPQICKKLSLDGVVVDLSKNEKPKAEFQYLRNFLGKDSIIGAITRNRRHEAMVISENEPDFVIFQAWQEGIEQVKELVSWYNELFLIQSAVVFRDENMNYGQFDCDIAILSDREYTIFVAKK